MSFKNKRKLGTIIQISLIAFMMGLISGKHASAWSETPDLKLSTIIEPDLGTAQASLPQKKMVIAHKVYQLEVATTPEQSEKGLMYRTQLANNTGMLFLFQPAREVRFWMKNTLIPLDMLFLFQNRVVHIESNAQPCVSDPCETYPSVFPVDMVVELPGGTAEKDKINIGAHALLEITTKNQTAPLESTLKSSASHK